MESQADYLQSEKSRLHVLHAKQRWDLQRDLFEERIENKKLRQEVGFLKRTIILLFLMFLALALLAGLDVV